MPHNQIFRGSILRCLSAGRGWQSPASAIAGYSLLTACMILASGCTANADTAIEASLDKDFQLQIGQSALLAAENLEVGFQAVTSDSRCGKGETCIWEGNATARIWVRIDGGAKEESELHSSSRMLTAVDFANFSIGLVALNPPAIAGRDIEQTEYIATFRVVRGISGGKVIY